MKGDSFVYEVVHGFGVACDVGSETSQTHGRYVLIHEQSVVLSDDSSVLGDIFAVCNSQLLVRAVDENSGLVNVLPVILECGLSRPVQVGCVVEAFFKAVDVLLIGTWRDGRLVKGVGQVAKMKPNGILL